MSGGRHLLEKTRVIRGMGPNRKEDGLDAVVGKRRKHVLRVFWPGAIIERQHNFAVAQEVVGLEKLRSEGGATGGVDFDSPGNAEGVRIAGTAGCAGGRWRSRRRRGCRRG